MNQAEAFKTHLNCLLLDFIGYTECQSSAGLVAIGSVFRGEKRRALSSTAGWLLEAVDGTLKLLLDQMSCQSTSSVLAPV